MFDAETIEFLHSGCALIIGTVGPDGAPRATRGWGLDVTSPQEHRVRLFLDADDHRTIEHLQPGAAVAVTGTDVFTFRSTQLKGRSLGIEPATRADHERVRRYADMFFGDIHEAEGTPRELPERLFPMRCVACSIAVVERFDQTPGPQAGAPLGRAAS